VTERRFAWRFPLLMAAAWFPTPTPHAGTAVHAGFHIPYEVKDTAYGKGLFVTVDIPAGTLLWKCQTGKQGDANINVLSFTTEAEARSRLAQLTPEEASYWMGTEVSYCSESICGKVCIARRSSIAPQITFTCSMAS
jgi:hypothetical protein